MGTVSNCPLEGCGCVKIKLACTIGTVSNCPIEGCGCVKITLACTMGTMPRLRPSLRLARIARVKGAADLSVNCTTGGGPKWQRRLCNGIMAVVVHNLTDKQYLV